MASSARSRNLTAAEQKRVLEQRIDSIMENADAFLDPISAELGPFLNNPVYLPASGHCYANETVEKLREAKESCPYSREPLGSSAPIPDNIRLIINEFKDAPKQVIGKVETDDPAKLDEIFADYEALIKKMNIKMNEAKDELVSKTVTLNVAILKKINEPESLSRQSYEYKELPEHKLLIDEWERKIEPEINNEINNIRAQLPALTKLEVENKISLLQGRINVLVQQAKDISLAKAERSLVLAVPVFFRLTPLSPMFAGLNNEFKALQAKVRRELAALSAPQIILTMEAKIAAFAVASRALVVRARALAIGEVEAKLGEIPPNLTNQPERRLSLAMRNIIEEVQEAKQVAKRGLLDEIAPDVILQRFETSVAQYRARIIELSHRMTAAVEIERRHIEGIKRRLKIDVNEPAHAAFWRPKGKSANTIPVHIQAMMQAASLADNNNTVPDFKAALEDARRVSRMSRFFKDCVRDRATKELYDAPDLTRHTVL